MYPDGRVYQTDLTYEKFSDYVLVTIPLSSVDPNDSFSVGLLGNDYVPSQVFTIEYSNNVIDNPSNKVLSIKGLIDFLYPVGSIYVSMNETDPSKLFGGTWNETTSSVPNSYAWYRMS